MPDDPSHHNESEEIKRLKAENAELKRTAARQLAELDQRIAQLKEDGMTDAEIKRILKMDASTRTASSPVAARQPPTTQNTSTDL